MIILTLALIIPVIIGAVAYYFLVIKYREAAARREQARYDNFIRTINSDIFKHQML